MKHNYKFLAALSALFIAMIVTTNAQRTVNVPTGAILSDVIHGDTIKTGDNIGDRIDNNTVYVLERNGIYEVAKTLALDVPLQIKAADGAGFLPYIAPKQGADATWPALIKTKGDMTLENLQLSNQNGVDANAKWGGIKASGAGSTVKFIGCHIEWDKAAALVIDAADIKVLIEDCRISKMGNYNEWQGNGRIIDTRGKVTEEIIIRNTTFYLLSDRVIRNMGGEIKKLVFDHNTGFSVQGRHGCLALANVHSATITNNLIINPMYSGNHPLTEEQTGPTLDRKDLYIITVDQTTHDHSDRNIVIRNNNFAFEQPVLDVFNTIDSVSKPAVLAPLVATILGDDAANASMEEVVEFANVPAVPLAFLEAVYADPNAANQPDNFPDDIGIANIDCSYATTYTSFTAGDDGYPLGDLNWFPGMKEQFKQGVTNPTAIKNEVSNVASLKAYPNPFTSLTTIEYTLDKASDVEVSVYNATGMLMQTIANQNQITGTHSIEVSAAGYDAGLYFCKVKTNAGSSVLKIQIVK